MGTACFSVYGLGWLIQRSFHEAGMSKISPKPKSVPSSFVSFGSTNFLLKNTGRNKKPNRTGRTEPNSAVEFWNRPEPDAETNRTDPDRATTRPKNAGRTASNLAKYCSEPNRTEPINFRKIQNRHESNRTGSIVKIGEQVLDKHASSLCPAAAALS